MKKLRKKANTCEYAKNCCKNGMNGDDGGCHKLSSKHHGSQDPVRRPIDLGASLQDGRPYLGKEF